jgi:putative chitinase
MRVHGGDNIMITLNADTLRSIAPVFSGGSGAQQAEIIEAVGPVLRAILAEYAIDTDIRAAHFLAQICHESAGFRATEEFASGSAYEGRKDLGNTKPGDGSRYKGRGLIQLTGRANYAEYGEALGLDLLSNPGIARGPVTSLRIACEFWKRRGLNKFADQDDIETITRRINGGLNGLADRKAYLTKAKAVLGCAALDPSDARVLRQGDKSASVTLLQIKLNDAGYKVTTDGSFGPGTDAAVKHFQAAKGLTPDGIVGRGTWAALGGATLDASAAPVLRQGDKSASVTLLQIKLRDAGYKVTADGSFGPGTEAAVKRFQAAKGLTPDGIVGRVTWAALG